MYKKSTVIRYAKTQENDLMNRSSFTLVTILSVLLAGASVLAEEFKLERTSSGKPDLSGYYDAATLTPLNRPEAYGEKKWMTKAEAEAIAENVAALVAAASQNSDPDRVAPVSGGGKVKTGGGGGTGGYNAFWIDSGTDVNELDGQFRTSIIYDPPNGRQPALLTIPQSSYPQVPLGR